MNRPVLPLGRVGVDDVVVEVVFPRTRGYGQQLASRRVDHDAPQAADFGGNVNGHAQS